MKPSGPLIQITLSFLITLSVGPVMAAAFTVNSTFDAPDANTGNGFYADSLGRCTLRAAIMEADSDSTTDSINIPAGTYTITISGSGEQAGSFDITNPLIIKGNDPKNTIIDGNSIDVVFLIESSWSNLNMSVEFINVTVTNGNGWFGGGIENAIGRYGGIAKLTITNSSIKGNSAGSGAGITTGGGFTIKNTIVANNTGSANCSAGVTSNGNNIDSDNSYNFNQRSDLPGVDPLLGTLADNGVPTRTHALLTGSGDSPWSWRNRRDGDCRGV